VRQHPELLDEIKSMSKTRGKKTSQDYWERTWEKEKSFTYGLLGRLVTYGFLSRLIESPIDRKFELLLKKYLPYRKGRILEIGCASGKKLVWFNQEFGYDVYGIDYSQAGCELAEEILRRNKVEGRIICGDVFDTSFQEKYAGYFDVVFSGGVIEHFAAPDDIVDAHLKLLRKGGFLVITIPNFGDSSIYRKGVRLAGREKRLLRTHNVKLMKIANFKDFAERLENIEIRYLSYVYPIMFPIRIRYISYLISYVIGYLTFFLDLNSEVLSPHIMLVARKH